MKKHIDEIFKDKFKEFEAPVSDGLWDKIQQNTDWQKHLRQQKIRNLTIYGALAVVVISSCIALIYQRNHADIKAFNQEPSVEQAFEETGPTIPANAPEANPAPIETGITENIEKQVAESDAANTQPTNTGDNATIENIASENNVSNQETIDNPTNPMPVQSCNPNSKPVPDNSGKTTTNENNTKTENTIQRAVNETNSEPNNPTDVTQRGSLFSIPNAFTPNGDGLNDIFKPVTAASIMQYQMDIFTMNGQHVFTSKSLDYGWNGEQQGGNANGGSYIYIIKYKDDKGKEHIDKGQLLLIR